MVLRRGFALGPADRVAVVEDVVTTGGSTRETIAVAEAAGAVVVSAAALIDRSGSAAGFAVPFHALATLTIETYDATSCPQCAAGSTAVKPGSRA